MFFYMNLWIKICWKILLISTIQKPDYRNFSATGFAAALKPNVFYGANYKRWRAKMILWLTAMNVYHVALGKPVGPLTSNEDSASEAVDNLFRGAVISVLGENLVDAYMHLFTSQELWEALEVKFGVSDAGNERYVMEQFHDYRIVDDRSVVEQAHEIQSLAKELENFPGCIIANLPHSWKDFATSLKHKRQEFSVADLIGSLDVEEKARVKDTRVKGHEGNSSANLVQKKNFQFQKKAKNKAENKNNTNQITNFKKKKNNKKGGCFVCGDSGHWAKDCSDRKDKHKKSANVIVASTEGGTSGYGNLPSVLSVCHIPDWWIDTGVNIHVCADISLFSSYQVARTCSVLMVNGSYASVRGVGTVNLKFTSGKIVQLR